MSVSHVLTGRWSPIAMGPVGKAYRLWVADSPEQLAAGRYIYDSGKVLSGESVGVVYQGKALQPSTRYYWKVSVWDESGTEITSTDKAPRGSRPVFWVPDGAAPVGSARRRHNSPNIARIM